MNPTFTNYGDGRKTTEYFKDGKKHRENGPAIIHYDANGIVRIEEYFINDKRHRENGPAVIHYNEDGNIKYKSYYLNGDSTRFAPAGYYNKDGTQG
jgi:hypothetical protein